MPRARPARIGARPSSPSASSLARWAVRMSEEIRAPVPPFTEETARQKVQAAEDAWNTCDPERVAGAYTVDSQWRNRNEFFQGREAIVEFLRRKWSRELDYRLKKELWCFTDNRISVRFEYESRDLDGQWWRSHGNEHWEFDEHGYMAEHLTVPVINPGPVVIKMAETFVQLGLTHSKVAFPPPSEIVDDRFFALPSAEAPV